MTASRWRVPRAELAVTVAFCFAVSGPRAAFPGGNEGQSLPTEVREVVEFDWLRQEAALRRCPGSDTAVRGVLSRGRVLLRDPVYTDHPGLVSATASVLDTVEDRLEALAESRIKSSSSSTPLRSEDGWYLVRAAVCGAGPEWDRHRVRGQDWDYGAPMLRADGRSFSGLNTVSFDPESVAYRFSGLDATARYRLHCFLASEAARAMSVTVNGQELGTTAVPPGREVERVDLLPHGLNADGDIAVHIGRVHGPNAVVSALELWSTSPDPLTAAERDGLIARRRRIQGQSGVDDPALRELYLQARWAVRRLALSAPRLGFDELLFVRRQWPSWNHQCSHRVGEAQTPGANLTILSGLDGNGTTRDLLDSGYGSGGVGRPDLSYDGQRIVFPRARPRIPATPYGFGRYAHRGGACHMYDLYEIGVDGTGLRRLTFSEVHEDTEPAYMPDGSIVFTSSRCGQLVQCGDWALVFGLFRLDPATGEIQAITRPQDSEFYPAVLPDGRILYTRWDYVMKPYNVIQQLWTVNPDGCRSQLAFGHWYAFSRGPLALFEARPVPGTQWIVAVGGAHHNTGVGPVMLADLNRNRSGPSGLVNITPEVGYPEASGLDDERTDTSGADIPPISNHANSSGWYASPWPLSERHFLVAYSHEPDNAAPHGYGLYLIDTYGNKELIHRGADYSCYAPIPLRPRPRPPVLASARPPDAPVDEPARLYVQDVYTGLDAVPRGTVKWLRINVTYPKTQHTWPARSDVGVGSGWDFRGILGTVPVEDDGSTYFEVPPHAMLWFQALDEEYREVRRMANYVDLQPGEIRGCVGCHEHPSQAASPRRMPRALAGAPAIPSPPPWGAGPVSFPKLIQPVLDRHCTACHDGGAGDEHAFDLRGTLEMAAPHAGDLDEGPQHLVSDSFLALLPHVAYLRMTGYAGRKLPLPPYATGSALSPLVEMLRNGHKGVVLSEDELRAFCAWIDCNAPFNGTYEEIRNVDRHVPSHVTAQAEREGSDDRR